MKLYKIDFTNTIGDYMVTVPTDSQFLIGISNGDSEADVELLDGETEITPGDEKIGAYTVFNFETDGTPFRKHLKANINGQKPATKFWDAYEYEITDGTLTGTMAILDDDLFAQPDPEAPSRPIPPTATEMTVKFKDASGNYSTTLVYTFYAVAMAGGLPSSVWKAPTEIDEAITSVIPVPKQIRLKNAPLIGWGWNKIEPNYTGQSSSVNWKATPLVADIQIPYEGYDPYTDKLNIVVKCDKMSVAYRDFEGDIPSGEALVDAILDDEEAAYELKAKMQVDTPFQITEPNASTQTIVITKDNYADIANKVWMVGSDTTADNIKNIALEINRTDFPSGNNFWHFIVSYKFPTDYHYMAHLSQMRDSFKIKDGNNTFNLNNVHKYQDPNTSFILPQTGLGGQTLSFEFFWDETITTSDNSKFIGGRLVNATVDMTDYI